MYLDRVSSLGTEWADKTVNSTRFKEYLLNKLGSDWAAYHEGREIFLSSKETVGEALAEMSRMKVTVEEAEKIVDVGLILRKYVLLKQMPFDGAFSSHCLTEPVAQPLLTLLDVMLEGSNSIAEGLQNDETQKSSKVAKR